MSRRTILLKGACTPRWLSVYARHSKACPKKDDLNWKRYRCPKWINGTLDGRFIRKTAKTGSWEKLEDLLQFKPDPGDGVAADPEMLTRKIPLFAAPAGQWLSRSSL